MEDNKVNVYHERFFKANQKFIKKYHRKLKYLQIKDIIKNFEKSQPRRVYQ